MEFYSLLKKLRKIDTEAMDEAFTYDSTLSKERHNQDSVLKLNDDYLLMIRKEYYKGRFVQTMYSVLDKFNHRLYLSSIDPIEPEHYMYIPNTDPFVKNPKELKVIFHNTYIVIDKKNDSITISNIQSSMINDVESFREFSSCSILNGGKLLNESTTLYGYDVNDFKNLTINDIMVIKLDNPSLSLFKDCTDEQIEEVILAIRELLKYDDAYGLTYDSLTDKDLFKYSEKVDSVLDEFLSRKNLV